MLYLFILEGYYIQSLPWVNWYFISVAHLLCQVRQLFTLSGEVYFRSCMPHLWRRGKNQTIG